MIGVASSDVAMTEMKMQGKISSISFEGGTGGS